MTAITKLTHRFSEADIEEEIVVMRLDTGDFYAITGTGATIWRMIDGSRTRDDLTKLLAEEFDGDGTGLSNDVDRYLDELERHGLIAYA